MDEKDGEKREAKARIVEGKEVDGKSKYGGKVGKVSGEEGRQIGR